MNSMSLARTIAIVFIAALFLALFPLVDAQAQSRMYWNSDEGEDDNDSEERVSRRGVSSSVQRKINNLDDDEVEEFPIPILLGVALRQISENFGDPRDGGTRSHEGLDIMANKGSYIVSPTEAVVIRTGTGSSAGKYVYTANPGGETFIYMHLDDIADGLRSGTELKVGDLIGYVGNTGNASGGAPHLHFEVRDGREATDPYPRLEGEFTLAQRIDALEEMIKDAEDEEEEAETIVANYRTIIVAARAAGIDLSDELEEALGIPGTAAAGSTSGFTRDLQIGSTGAEVTALQTFLIAANAGPKATALLSAGATGYFGALTQAALAEYQAKEGISPAAGYFGPRTRAHIAAQ